MTSIGDHFRGQIVHLPTQGIGGKLASYTADINVIERNLSLDRDSIMKLVNIDRGQPGAHMKTLGLVTVLRNSQSYIFEHGCFKKTQDLYPLDLDERAGNPKIVEIPPYIEVDAVWDLQPQSDCENVFGETVRLFVNSELLEIPKVKATDAALAYYGGTIVPEGVAIKFPSAEFPIFMMDFGDNWLRDGVQTEAYGGVFLEYHHDQPHFHMAYDDGSYYILAKWAEDFPNKLQITAFELPPGEGVYTKKGAIHNDVAVKGNLLIGYMTSNDFSVAFLRDNPQDNHMVRIEVV